MTGSILIVDDDRGTVLVLSRLLKNAGFPVITAQEATQAVMQAHREHPALIITDLVMPSGGGLSVLERLGMSSHTNSIPILVLTASEDPNVESQAVNFGAVQVLRKPCDPLVLLDAVRAVLGGQRP